MGSLRTKTVIVKRAFQCLGRVYRLWILFWKAWKPFESLEHRVSWTDDIWKDLLCLYVEKRWLRGQGWSQRDHWMRIAIIKGEHGSDLVLNDWTRRWWWISNSGSDLKMELQNVLVDFSMMWGREVKPVSKDFVLSNAGDDTATETKGTGSKQGEFWTVSSRIQFCTT